ncbi:hypothetical protein TrST_g3077 [Triparma strigata]|uniref:Uncharacterized protein n=1 Tax=Triparma strigata TaxID=1606541 RepID=A0A9W7AQR9_9STRA|nr:hypothetical protein TrST_g3077 [Triparma strigata]
MLNSVPGSRATAPPPAAQHSSTSPQAAAARATAPQGVFQFTAAATLPPNKRKARLPGPADAKRTKFLQDTVENTFAQVNLTRPLEVNPTGSILRHRLPPAAGNVEDLEEEMHVMHGVSIEVTVSPTGGAEREGGGTAMGAGTHTLIGVEEKEETNGEGMTHMGFFMNDE